MLVSLQGASVNFGAVQALRPLDLLLHRGDRLALVGANGSGKTTLLRALHGLVPCSGTRVLHPTSTGQVPVAAMVAALVDRRVSVEAAMSALLSRPLKKE